MLVQETAKIFTTGGIAYRLPTKPPDALTSARTRIQTDALVGLSKTILHQLVRNT